MIDSGMFRRPRQMSWPAFVLGAMALLSACSSSDQRPLVLVNAPLGVFANTAYQVQITVTVGTAKYPKSIFAKDYGTGEVGIYLDAGSSGDATISVVVLDVAGCMVATGASAAPVKVQPGQTTPVVPVTLAPAAVPCGVSDGGVSPEAGGAAGSDTSGVGVAPEVAPIDSTLDAGPKLDAEAMDVTLPGEVERDTPVEPDAPTDSTSAPDLPVLDAATEPLAPPADLPVAVDVGSEEAADAPPTTASVFAHCGTFKHSETEQGTSTGYLAISGVLFTPDNRHLISFANDGRAKVWDVAASGLVTTATGLEFTGVYELRGAISSDGSRLAIGDSDGNVVVYDFPASLASGAAVEIASLPVGSLPRVGNAARPMGFATDGNHLVVQYSAYHVGDPNEVEIWDLSTHLVVRQVDMADDQDYPMAFLPGSFTSSMWLATEEKIYSDAGGYSGLVRLMDMAKTPIATVEFMVSGEDVYAMAFSPDGNTLAIGSDSAELSLWDISNKSQIAQLGSPVVAASSGNNWINALAYSDDGKYVATAIGGWSSGYSVKLSSVSLPRQTLTKALQYDGCAVDISPDGLALAVGETDHGTIVFCTP